MNEEFRVLMHDPDDRRALLYLKGVVSPDDANVDRFYAGLSDNEIALLRSWLYQVRKEQCNCEKCQLYSTDNIS